MYEIENAGLVRTGGSLRRFPPGRVEVEQRSARRAAIERARKGATTEIIAGRTFTVLRLEDAPGGDYPLPDDPSTERTTL